MECAKIIGIAPQLVVKDVVATAEYYRDVLGFSILSYFNDPPVYAMVERDNFAIHFGKSDGDAVQTNETIRKATADFVIWVPEIELFFDKVKSNGADIVQEVIQRSYGREFIIRDCDRHQIMVVD
jgi:predicted enzyme related to lactoylglutathione lyase